MIAKNRAELYKALRRSGSNRLYISGNKVTIDMTNLLTNPAALNVTVVTNDGFDFDMPIESLCVEM